MARGRPRFPIAAKLASVVAIGMGLGLLIALAANPVMKPPIEPSRQFLGQSHTNETPPDIGWGAARLDSAFFTGPDGYRPDFDYEAVVGEEWAFTEPKMDGDLPSFDEASQVADEAEAAANAAQEAAEPSVQEAEASKPPLLQGGLY